MQSPPGHVGKTLPRAADGAAKGERRSLTGLRGIAALVVMVYHYRRLGIAGPRLAGSFGPGYLMVDLFFVLSGVVIARTYGAAFRLGFSSHAYLRFLEARWRGSIRSTP
jgi:peptidoglycan/LPS O-acetylase OafA/YrhL